MDVRERTVNRIADTLQILQNREERIMDNIAGHTSMMG